MKAFRIAGERALKLSSGKMASWKYITKDDKFITLPNYNPPVDAAPHAITVDEPLSKTKKQKKLSYKLLLETVRSPKY